MVNLGYVRLSLLLLLGKKSWGSAKNFTGHFGYRKASRGHFGFRHLKKAEKHCHRCTNRDEGGGGGEEGGKWGLTKDLSETDF